MSDGGEVLGLVDPVILCWTNKKTRTVLISVGNITSANACVFCTIAKKVEK